MPMKGRAGPHVMLAGVVWEQRGGMCCVHFAIVPRARGAGRSASLASFRTAVCA